MVEVSLGQSPASIGGEGTSDLHDYGSIYEWEAGTLREMIDTPSSNIESGPVAQQTRCGLHSVSVHKAHLGRSSRLVAPDKRGWNSSSMKRIIVFSRTMSAHRG